MYMYMYMYGCSLFPCTRTYTYTYIYTNHQASAAGHGGYSPALAETLGNEGTVLEVVAASGDVRVKFSSQRTFLFNPRVCR